MSTTLAPRAVTSGVGASFGTFGELLQGSLPGEGDFLVTLPIARWSTARFDVLPDSSGLEVVPAHKTKSLAAARSLMDVLGAAVPGRLTVDSGIPEGKGLASSSADLVAALRAVSHALGADLPEDLVGRILREIEPTDGVMYPAVVAYHHRRARLAKVLGSLPEATVVGLDEGGSVDTVAFNRTRRAFTPAEEDEYAALLARLSAAVASGELADVGRIATRSAVMYQDVNPKRALSSVLRVCDESGALGVVNAHSGTALGVLLDRSDPDYRDKLTHVAGRLRALDGEVALYRTLSFPPHRGGEGGQP